MCIVMYRMRSYSHVFSCLHVGAVVVANNLFGTGISPFVARNFRCSGSEDQLFHCTHSIIPINSQRRYSSSYVVGVICQGNTSKPTECTPGDVRLVGGSKNTEGRVEVCTESYWAVACIRSLYSSTIKLLCKQLGYPTYGKYTV